MELIRQHKPDNPDPRRKYTVLYLDRSDLDRDQKYLKKHGLVNGRRVENQNELFKAVKNALKPNFNFVVWRCGDWTVDREMFENATVVMGAHGGHFTNIIFAPAGTHIVEFGRSYLIRWRYQVDSFNYNGATNPRMVYAGLSNALGHHHWYVDDLKAVKQYKEFG